MIYAKKFLTQFKQSIVPIIATLAIVAIPKQSFAAQRSFNETEMNILFANYEYEKLQERFRTDFPPLKSKKFYDDVQNFDKSQAWLVKKDNLHHDPYLSFELTRRLIYAVGESNNYGAMQTECGPIIFNIIHIIAQYKCIKALYKKFKTEIKEIPSDAVNIWIKSYIHRLSQNQTIFGIIADTSIHMQKYVQFKTAQESFNKYYKETIFDKIEKNQDFFRFLQLWKRCPIGALFVSEKSKNWSFSESFNIWPYLSNLSDVEEANINKDLSQTIAPFSVDSSKIINLYGDDKVKGICNKVMFETFKQCYKYINETATKWDDVWKMNDATIKIEIILKESNEKETVLKL